MGENFLSGAKKVFFFLSFFHFLGGKVGAFWGKKNTRGVFQGGGGAYETGNFSFIFSHPEGKKQFLISNFFRFIWGKTGTLFG